MSTRLSPDAQIELEAARREFILKSVTKDDWEAIVLKAIDQAKHGNSAARQWLADYVAPAGVVLSVDRMDLSGLTIPETASAAFAELFKSLGLDELGQKAETELRPTAKA